MISDATRRHLIDTLARRVKEKDELRAEVERLRGQVAALIEVAQRALEHSEGYFCTNPCCTSPVCASFVALRSLIEKEAGA